MKTVNFMKLSFLLVGGLWPPGRALSGSLDTPPKKGKKNKSQKMHTFVINHHFEHEFTPETCLQSEISSRAFRLSLYQVCISSGMPIHGWTRFMMHGCSLAWPLAGPWPGPGWPLAWPLAGSWRGPWLALGLNFVATAAAFGFKERFTIYLISRPHICSAR